MLKSELKTGMWVLDKDNKKGIVLKDYFNKDYCEGVIYFPSHNLMQSINYYEEDLTCDNTYGFRNIMKVYTSKIFTDTLIGENLECIWERETFVPYLKNIFTDEKYGEIGTSTCLTALYGEKLYIGDIVEVYNTKQNKSFTQFVVETSDNIIGIMGYLSSSKNMINGIIRRAYIEDGEEVICVAKKIKSFKDVSNLEKDKSGTTAVKEEQEE